VGAFAALLALLVLLLYLSHYRNSVRSSSAPVPVLVATHLIPQGTAGDVLGTNDGFAATQVAKSAAKEGAISDPALLKGKVAVADIYPGQQLTVADFTATATATLGSRLAGKQRAMAIPVDQVHGLTGSVVAGDRVDVFADINSVVTAIAQNVYVLGVSAGGSSSSLSGGGSGSSSSLILRLTPAGAARMIFASEHGTLWIVLRPATHGGILKTRTVTVPPYRVGAYVPEGD
jgi:Flp pilus assembly protein CpaB